ncbi:hypothetical protein ACH5RR_021929 [Cinchona calisaya]|uniref:Nucleolar 27S pre-rRNA processing Urb2/Npa2 C-terminal domain-containing protein n=1 Tax=Cinchona calisaya TaxID=153742 RepID=A0ABD2ZAA1_9GENT
MEEAKENSVMIMKRKKKRKQILQERGDEENQRPSKTSRVNSSTQKTEEEDRKTQLNIEEGGPWRNLQLILFLQNKDIDLPTKLEVAFKYVQLKTHKGDDDDDDRVEVLDTVSISRVVAFVSNWIESVLISSVKKAGDRGCEGRLGTVGSCLDYRCWAIMKFCLEESLKVNVPLSYSRDFLRVIEFFSRDALTRLNPELKDSMESTLSNEGLELQEIVLNCISLVFSSHSGVVNANLDLWIMVTDTVLELVREVFENRVADSKAGIFTLQFSCCLLEPFTKFLRVHPARKNSFHDFVDRLLEPLMHLLDELHLSTSKNPGWSKNLLKLVEEVLSQGLFHTAHIDGFLGLQSTGKYKDSHNVKSKERTLPIKSYHRHLFDKLEKIIASKNTLPLGGVGELFRLFVKCATKQKGVSSVMEGSRKLEDSNGHIFERSSGSSNMALKKYNHSSSMSAETRKPLFNFFVQIMEFFLSHITTLHQAEWNVETPLLDVLCVLRSANKLLDGFKQENIYTRMEDISEGASMNFLRLIYETIMLFSVKIKHLLLSFGSNVGKQKEVLILMVKEIVVAVHHLVDIEYEVVGDDLENLWGMMLTFSACSQYTVDVPDKHLLSFEILNLGCAVIDLYSELRQVSTSMFALCKAARLLVSPLRDSETCTSEFYSLCSISLSTLLCSPEFRLSMYKGIKSIPEGQASACIQQLTVDISESLHWLSTRLQLAPGNNLSKPGCSDSGFSWFDLKAELLGRFLSEVYALVLDSMTVTAGNCNAVGGSIKDLMALMCHTPSSQDLLQQDIMDKFFSLLSGRTSGQVVGVENNSLSCWLLLFFFRLYLSCRSLYRQVISLAPSNTSRKMSETMGDPYASYSGKDWLEGIVQNAEGYFSWIIQPSASLLTIIHNVSSTYLQDTLAGCPPLVYVLNAMTLQRLVDLNRMTKSFDYLLARNDKLIEAHVNDDTGVSLSHKRSKKWRKHLLIMKDEAAGLTKFMMLCFSSLVKDLLTISNENGLSKDSSIQNLHKDISWDLSVGALDQNTLPSAIWLIICQHIDIWCGHAAKKDLKKFLTHLINCSISFGSGGNNDCRSHCTNKLGHPRNVTARQISLELLNDTGLYEQRFFRRHIASTYCQILEASLPSISADFGEGYLTSQSAWSEVIHALENSSNAALIKKCVKNNQSLQIKPSSQSVCGLHAETCRVEKLAPSSDTAYAVCNSLLNFLSWLPKGILSSKSFRSFATCILKLEQVVVGSLLGWYDTILTGGHNELFRLLLSCRRTLKSLLMASCEGNMDHNLSSLICSQFEGSSPVLWLLESLPAITGFQNAFSEEVDSQVKYMLFLLMDHTSYMFLTIGKNRFELALRFSGMDNDVQDNFAVVCRGTSEDEPHAKRTSRDNDPWRSLVLVADILREHMQKELAYFSQTYKSEKLGVFPEFHELKKLSPVISCIQGFLWGLASGLGNIDAENCEMKVRLSKCKLESVYKLNIFIQACAEFVGYFLHLFFLEVDSLAQNLANAQTLNLSELGHPSLAKEELFDKIGADANDALHEEMSQNSEPFGNIGSHKILGKSEKSVVKGKSRPKNEDVDSLLAKVQLFDQQCLKKTFLQDLFRGDKSEVAYFLKQLFLAASAILRLKLELGDIALLQNIIPILFGTSEILLLEFAKKVAPPTFSFVWLDGVVKFLEELGKCFPTSSPILSRKLYGKLIDLHLRSIGKCIVLQGKRATLSSKETESSMEMPIECLSFSESSLSHESYCLDDFISRLRMSFRVLIQKSSELHLFSAVQAIERAVVGVQEGCLSNYEIHVGSLGGGKVSSIVAAGIDCLDSVIEFVTGRKRLNVVKRHIQSLVACLFNVVLHLQGPSIFQGRVNSNEACTGPDSGSIILMCIQVLRRVTGKHALFQMDAWHVGQSLNTPATLFQNLLQLRFTEALGQSDSPTISETTDAHSKKFTSASILDQKYSVELYAACCRLLCTLVKHHISETQQCTALLEHSVSVLLRCLEMVNINQVVRRGTFVWEVQEGVKCACSLRRVYEEIRQQKDCFGRYCSQFLSCYIWIYCGFGPLKTGIRREIDDALRPGVYALIDACSPDDLQHLHTVFGEGPCRSTLASLQNDYKLYFQYGGKV